jgi:D-galactarolactone cycloisomerase
MTITSIRTYILKTPTEKAFYSSQGRFGGRKSFLVRIETADGLVGWGEGGQYGPAEPTKACVESVFNPMLLGQPATSPPLLWQRMFTTIRDFGTRGPYTEAMSAIDIALWDIAGKRFGVPVSELIGGRHRETVKAYGTGFYYPADREPGVDPEALAEECDAKLAAGFDAVKAKIGLLDVRADVERLQIVRDRLGPGVGLAVDSNHAYSLPTARRVARHLGELDVLWFEEPVVPEDKAAYRALRESSPVPVAGGECEFTRYGFHELISTGCVDVAQPDLGVAGGISEWMRISVLADVAGVAVVPHVWGSAVALAAALQVLAATPLTPHTVRPVPFQNEPVLEFDTTDNPLRSEIVTEKITLVDGRVAVPTTPGLGVTVDEAAVEHYAVG